jgi:integrase
MPKKVLTAAAVERIRAPGAGQISYSDAGFTGLALRVSCGGSKTWVYTFRSGSKVRRLTLGSFPAMSIGEARAAWREAHMDVKAGRDPSPQRRRQASLLFADTFEDWLRRDQAKNRTRGAIERMLRKDVLPNWRHRSVAEITRRDVLDVLDGIVDRGSPIMARRVHSHLSRLFNWSVERGILAASPMTGTKAPGEEKSRTRVLDDDELIRVWKAADADGVPFGQIIKLLILTGARRDEIGGLKWCEIHDDEICLEGDRTKNGVPHLIPLSAPAQEILRSLERHDGSHVFSKYGTPVSGYSKAQSRLRRAAAVPEHWTIHDIRRSVATGLQRMGVQLPVTEAVLGHVSGSRRGVIGIYQRHDYGAEKRSALEAWGAHVMAMVEGRKPGKVLFYLHTRIK